MTATNPAQPFPPPRRPSPSTVAHTFASTIDLAHDRPEPDHVLAFASTIDLTLLADTERQPSMRTVITFDISDDRKRYRVGKVLLGYATRVQKSVFEAPELARAAYLRMRSKVEREVDPKTDTIRYYPLCAACTARIEHYGKGPSLLDEPEPFEIIG